MVMEENMKESKKKYRVIYSKEKCISAFTCVAFYGERWAINNDDNKADLIGGKEEQPGIWTTEFTEEELELFYKSAEVCPVLAIEIYEIETKKKIFPVE